MEVKDLKYIQVDFSIKDICELSYKDKISFDDKRMYDNIDEDDFHIHLSKFIESTIIRFPVEPAWLMLDNNDDYTVIKGHKTFIYIDYFLVSLKGFVKLEKLAYLPELNGLSYSDLNKSYQSKIEEYEIPCYVVLPEASDDVVWDIFQRLK